MTTTAAATTGRSGAKPGCTLDSQVISTTVPFANHYTLHTKLRSGSYGVVWTTRHKATDEEFAVKVIDRTKLKKKDDVGIIREVGILKDLRDVENIVRLIDFYEDPKCFYIVQVYARGGDVFDRLAKRVSYTEKDSRDLATILLETMQEMHDRKLCHRDMKPENLLLKDNIDDTGILVADFGFATYVPEGGLKTRCGTPAFVAPEILVGTKYNQAVDMWSVGCLLYMIIGGYPPFQDESQRGLFRKIRAADFTFHDVYWKNVSIHAKQLISKLLTVDPVYRLSAKEALETAWLQMKVDSLSSRDLSSSLSEIKRFNARRKLKSAVHAVMWSLGTAFRHEKVSDLTKEADTIDANNPKVVEVNKNDAPSKRFSFSKTNKKRFEEVYEIGDKLHRGSFATVKRCRHKEWKQDYAVKIIKRDPSKPQTDYSVMHEVAVMNKLDHEHIVKVIDFFEEKDYYFIVMELMAGGDLFDRIVAMDQYTENDARNLAEILLKAVDYMHTKGMVHRDLKPQNLLLKSHDDNSTIKIADFGFASKVHTPKSLTSRCGTPSYVAPEILKNIPYDQSCDMWSVGVILYVMLCGYLPFGDDGGQEKMFQRIKQGDWCFDKEDWKHISQDAKDLITQMLTVHPDSRITAANALRSKWIRQDAASLSSRDLSQSLLSIKEKRPKLRDVARAFMALSALGTATKNALGALNPIEDEDGMSSSSSVHALS